MGSVRWPPRGTRVAARMNLVDPKSISRRQFNAAMAAGAAYSALTPFAAEQSNELCEMSAVELAARLARKDVSAREVMTAHLAQIERINPKVNAIVTLVAEQAKIGRASCR